MVIADHLRPACAGGAVRIDEGLRVDLEMGGRGGMDVACRSNGGDVPCVTQQDAATLLREAGPGFLLQPLHDPWSKRQGSRPAQGSRLTGLKEKLSNVGV